MKKMNLWKVIAAGFPAVVIALFTSCPSPVATPGIDDPDDDGPVVYSGADAWNIVPGGGNGVDSSTLSTEAGAFETGDHNGEGTLKVTYQSDTTYTFCELYAAMPIGDYSSYDGLRFDICIENGNSATIMDLIRIGGEATFKISEDYIWRGVDLPDKTWQTIELPFDSTIEIPAWGDTYVDDTGIDNGVEFKTWLGNNTTAPIQINLNPQLNGELSANTPYIIYLDNIGFYKGAGSGPDDVIFYDFEPEE